MKYLSEFVWTHSWDVGTLVPNKSKFLTLIANISVLPGFNLLHLNTIVSLVGHLLRSLVLLHYMYSTWYGKINIVHYIYIDCWNLIFIYSTHTKLQNNSRIFTVHVHDWPNSIKNTLSDLIFPLIYLLFQS